ncbi:MAG: hypothetical protein R3C18_07945 [Planctomycetaceae bacterium]
MSDPNEPFNDEAYAEMFRICDILETVAANYPDGSPESAAIVAAAEAFVLVHQQKVLAKAYQRLKAARNGELGDELDAKLRSMGINPDELDELDF